MPGTERESGHSPGPGPDRRRETKLRRDRQAGRKGKRAWHTEEPGEEAEIQERDPREAEG